MKMSQMNGVVHPRGKLAHNPEIILSLAPPDVLERIAKQHGVPVSSLSSMVIGKLCRQLYGAILCYAAYEPNGDIANRRPLFVDSFQANDEESEDEVDDTDDDFLDESDDESDLLSFSEGGEGRQSRISAIRRKMARYHGLRRMPPLVPEHKFSLGETTIEWPPPPHLQAAALVDARREERKRGKSKNGTLSPESIVTTASNSVEDRPVVENKEKKHIIHVLHYGVGEPRGRDPTSMSIYSEILLVSPESSDVLRRFTKEVLEWDAEKCFSDGRGHSFQLYRFKMDREDHGWWHLEGVKRARPPSSVILSKGQIEAIWSDVRNFAKPVTRKWYQEHGLQHRRAYLFYGPPGTGKTSTIRALSSSFRLKCCFLSMTNASFSNQNLCDALSTLPDRALLVLEDVDALFNEDRKNEQAASLTFSGLLNALDGLISADGIITVMTTNHIDRLDQALIRGGRVDRRFFFSKPSNDQLKDLFLSFYPGAKENDTKKFLERVAERPEGDEARSIATLQQLFIDQRGNSAEECVESIPSFYEAHFPNGTDRRKAFFYT